MVKDEWVGEEAALIPEREGDTTMMVCQRIGGKLVFSQRLYTHTEITSASVVHLLLNDLSKMLAGFVRHRINANRDPEKEPRFDPNHKHDD